MQELRSPVDAEYLNRDEVKIRSRITLDWLKQFSYDISGSGRALDIGDRSLLAGMIEREFVGAICENTDCDLDYELETQFASYKNIFCFEVLEHLMNPLAFLERAKAKLSDSGAIYLSTPIDKPGFLRNKEWHFHEFYTEQLDSLIEKAGLIATHRKRINSIPPYWMFIGIRSALRYLKFHRIILLRLVSR